MGIKNAILRVADKAGNAVASVSALSSAQLADINKRRESYLSQRPDPSDQTAACGRRRGDTRSLPSPTEGPLPTH